MFEKLLATLPYNPGLANQVAFYGRRMREESTIRRTGLIFIVLAFMIQFFTVLSPPQPTIAASSNDLINGGISSAANAQNHCNNNTQHFKNILDTYGITCAQVGAAKTVNINANGQNFYSFGRIQQGFPSEQPVNIDNLGTIYGRKLSDWGPSTYKALQLTASSGKTFWILYDCGNLVSIGMPNPVNPCQYNSSIPASSPQCFNKCQYNPNIPASSPECFNKCQYNPSIPASSPQCFNKCRYDASIPASSPQCFNKCPVPGKQNIPKSSPQCSEPCPYNKSIKASDDNCVPPNNPVCQYDASLPPNSPACKPPDNPVCKYNPSLPPDSPECQPCDKQISSANKDACIAVHKAASNITTGTADANNTQVNAGDVITYTLFAQNNGKEAVKDFTFTENMNDVLDYSDITDLHGGTIDNDKVVTWPKTDIKAGATATVQVTVKVKNPVPQAPVGSSDPTRFDLNMTNVYGNTVNIKLPGSPEKTVEGAAATLPNTGPGTNLFIGSLIVVAAGYFFSRSRLLAQEATIALKESTAGV